MGEMPVRGVAIFCGVLAERGEEEAVREGEGADGDGGEELG